MSKNKKETMTKAQYSEANPGYLPGGAYNFKLRNPIKLDDKGVEYFEYFKITTGIPTHTFSLIK